METPADRTPATERNLAVGWFDNEPFQEVCGRNLARIKEVFFAWPGVLSCRPAPAYTPELRARQVDDLKWARANGIELDTLFNCNCYGDVAISTELADFVERTMREMDAEGLLPETVTTTSPFIATVLRRRFPQARIRLSVNQRVHGSVGFEPILPLFDSFYATRERHREIAWLKGMSEWARAHGKTMGIQANSGCIRQCPYQQFHDNMHGHNRIRQSKAGEPFGFSVFLCRENYERGNYEDFLRSTWLRPEDLPLYEPFVDVVKLATRRHPFPGRIVDAYARRSYDGNLADLMDARHVFPKSIDNASFDKARSLWDEVRECPDANDCRHCGKCAALLDMVFGHRPAAPNNLSN